MIWFSILPVSATRSWTIPSVLTDRRSSSRHGRIRERTGDPVDVVLTEFIDPNGIDVYFKIPNLTETQSIRLVDDELLSEPRRSANGEITLAWYGPKERWRLEGSVSPLTANWLPTWLPITRTRRANRMCPLSFPDKSTTGSWSLFNCTKDGSAVHRE